MMLSLMGRTEKMSDLALIENPDGKIVNSYNNIYTFTENLPNLLKEMTYEALVEVYYRLQEFSILKWRISTSLLAEAYYRIKQNVPHGEQKEVLTQLAKDFGVKAERVYQKVQLWKTFYQNPETTDKVDPSDNSYVFDQLPGGEAYFRVALETHSPIEAIREAENKYLGGMQVGTTYTVNNFRDDLLKTTNKEDRYNKTISSIKRTINILSLFDQEDRNYECIHDIIPLLEDLIMMLEEG